MGIPTSFSGNTVSLHGLVATDNIFYRTTENMVDTRFAVDRRRTFIKREKPLRRLLIQAFVKNPVFIPVGKYL